MFRAPADAVICTYGPCRAIPNEIYEHDMEDEWCDYGVGSQLDENMTLIPDVTGRDQLTHLGPFVNTASEELGQVDNVKYRLSETRKTGSKITVRTVLLVSLRPIFGDEELFVSYGEGFKEQLATGRAQMVAALKQDSDEAWLTKRGYKCPECNERMMIRKARVHRLICRSSLTLNNIS